MTRNWRAWVGSALLLAAIPEVAAACQACGGELVCVWSPSGANFCLGNGDACLMAGRCNPGPFLFPSEVAPTVQLTILESAPGFAPGRGSRLERGVGAVVGREAGRVAGAIARSDAVVFSGIGRGDGVTVAFASPIGDGFTLRRESQGRGGRVQVRALLAGRPGATLADERLEEDDALVVRITLGGLPRVLVLQAPTLGRAEAEARQSRLARTLARESIGRPGDPRPPFEVRTIDD